MQSLTGAAFVRSFHHQIRSAGAAPKGATESVDAPAHAAHCDYTPFSGLRALGQMAALCPKDDGLDYRRGRVCMINVWRNISDDAVIHNDHLAVCDGRSVVAPPLSRWTQNRVLLPQRRAAAIPQMVRCGHSLSLCSMSTLWAYTHSVHTLYALSVDSQFCACSLGVIGQVLFPRNAQGRAVGVHAV